MLFSLKYAGADLKLGKITLCVGDMAVIPSPHLKGALSLKTARRLYGKTVSVDGLKIGRVFDVIGRVDMPCFIVRLSKDFNKCEVFIGKTSYVT
jgi:rRNA processing protein Gar1